MHDPDGLRLPIKIDTTSNGEFEPVPLTRANELANQRGLEIATANARRVALERRAFLTSTCGAAVTLLAHNEVNAAAGNTGGFFDVPREAGYEVAAADASIGGDEFIFDVQGHYVDPNGQWLEQVPDFAKLFPSPARPIARWAKVTIRIRICSALGRRSSSKTCSSIPIPI